MLHPHVCACKHVYKYAYLQVQMHMHVNVSEGQMTTVGIISWELSPAPSIFRQGHSLAWNLLVSLSWLAIKLQKPACLGLPAWD